MTRISLIWLVSCLVCSLGAGAGTEAKYSPVLNQISVSDLEFENNMVNEIREKGAPSKSEAVAAPTRLPKDEDVSWTTKAMAFISGIGEKLFFEESEQKKPEIGGRKSRGKDFRLTTDCSLESVLAPIREHLRSVSQREAFNSRFFSFHHFMCQNNIPQVIKKGEFEDALNILLNSMSWSEDLVRATAINEERTLFKIDLRDYKRATGNHREFVRWNAEVWQMLVQKEPYHILQIQHPILEEIQDYTGEDYPVLRGDWFLAHASHSPLYDKIMGYEGNISNLYRILGLDLRTNISKGLAVRAGFKDSGVSNFNRLLERHPIKEGAFWISYDFAGSSGRRSFFRNPLGPDLVLNKAFEHDGGEVIFNLPNGLQAYKLIDSKGGHLDVGPSEVVSHSVSSDKRVQNAVSCMGCHSEGILDKEDEVLESVFLNRADFTSREFNIIQSLYPGANVVLRHMKEDRERYQEALSEIVDKENPGSGIVFNLTRYYEKTVSFEAVAAELGVSLDHFTYIALYTNFRDTFGVLLNGGKIMRIEIENIFSERYGSREDIILLINLTRKRLNTNPSFGENYTKQNFVQGLTEIKKECFEYRTSYRKYAACLSDGLEDVSEDTLNSEEQGFINTLIQTCESDRMGDVFIQSFCLENFIKFAEIVPLNSNILAPICKDFREERFQDACFSGMFEYADKEVL